MQDTPAKLTLDTEKRFDCPFLKPKKDISVALINNFLAGSA